MIYTVGIWVIPLSAVVFLIATLVSRVLKQEDTARATVLAKELETPQVYVYDKDGIFQRSQDAYFDLLESCETWFCETNQIPPSAAVPKDWVQKLPPEKKNILSSHLLEYAIAWVFFCRACEKERNRISPLNRHGLINAGYYESVRAADEHMLVVYKQIKYEAEMIYPGQDPSAIIRESVDILDNRGYVPGTGLMQWLRNSAPPAAKSAPPVASQVDRQIVKSWKGAYLEFKQSAEELEVLVWVPPMENLTAKDVTVRQQAQTLQVMVRDETMFADQLVGDLEFGSADDLTWTLHKAAPFETNDEVELHGLSKEELNGQRGTVAPANRDSTAKQRIRVKLNGAPKKRGAKDDCLSIKAENLKNLNLKKLGVQVVLIKKQKNQMWALPPFSMQ